MRSHLPLVALLAAAVLLGAAAIETDRKIAEKIRDLTDAIESELRGMDSEERDGFLSNLSTAIASTLQAIGGRLPEIPYIFGQKETVSAAQQALVEEEEDED